MTFLLAKAELLVFQIVRTLLNHFAQIRLNRVIEQLKIQSTGCYSYTNG